MIKAKTAPFCKCGIPEVTSVNFEKLTLVDDNNNAYLNLQSEFVDIVDKHISI
jgi:hypothetical protein